MSISSLQETYGFQNPFNVDALAKKALRYLDKGGDLLDVGCGEGADSVFFANRGFRVTAIDANLEDLDRLRAYRRNEHIERISILERDAVTYRYRPDRHDVINCLLVICCMRKSEFERMLGPLQRSVKPGGVIIMSSRNYLDPEFKEYRSSEKMIEPNTFRKKDGKCKHLYFIEKNRLREVFDDFEILYYYEGFAPCKYDEHPKHGDSYIICRRKGHGDTESPRRFKH